MKNKLFAFASIAFALVLVGAGCSGTEDNVNVNESDNDSAVEDMSPVKIGWIGPLTGEAAIYGEVAKKINEMAVEKINVDGGINGRSLEVVYEDGKCNGKDATNAMQKLVAVDKVQIVIGGFCSGESISATSIANQNQVVMLSPGSSSPELTRVGGDYFFRNFPSDATQAVRLAEEAGKRGWKNVAILQEQTDYAQALSEAFEKAFQEKGGLVNVERFTTGNTDFKTSLTKLRVAEPDALFLSVQTVKPVEIIMRQLKELDWSPAIFSGNVMFEQAFVDKFKDQIENSFYATFDVSKSDIYKQFKSDFKEKHDEEVPYETYAQTEYDAAFLVADALRSAGNDGKRLRDWFDTVENWEGVSGIINFDENGDRTGAHQELYVVRDGKIISESEM